MYGLTLNSWGGRNSSIEADVEQSLGVLLMTRKGEKIHNPNYGCDLVKYIDRPNWHLSLAMVAILESVNAYEPRVQLLKVNIVPAKQGELAQGIVRLQLVYRLKASGILSALLLTF